jgi:hypothetical protein
MSDIRMSRWTDAKLEKELAFAEAANEPGADAAAWLQAIRQEIARRDKD